MVLRVLLGMHCLSLWVSQSNIVVREISQSFSPSCYKCLFDGVIFPYDFIWVCCFFIGVVEPWKAFCDFVSVKFVWVSSSFGRQYLWFWFMFIWFIYAFHLVLSGHPFWDWFRELGHFVWFYFWSCNYGPYHQNFLSVICVKHLNICAIYYGICANLYAICTSLLYACAKWLVICAEGLFKCAKRLFICAEGFIKCVVRIVRYDVGIVIFATLRVKSANLCCYSSCSFWSTCEVIFLFLLVPEALLRSVDVFQPVIYLIWYYLMIFKLWYVDKPYCRGFMHLQHVDKPCWEDYFYCFVPTSWCALLLMIIWWLWQILIDFDMDFKALFWYEAHCWFILVVGIGLSWTIHGFVMLFMVHSWMFN